MLMGIVKIKRIINMSAFLIYLIVFPQGNFSFVKKKYNVFSEVFFCQRTSCGLKESV